MLSPVWGSILLWYIFASQSEKVFGLLGCSISVSIAVSWWYSRYTAHYMVVELQSFKLAFKSTFYPVIMKLAFLPFIGGLFACLLGSKEEDPDREHPE